MNGPENALISSYPGCFDGAFSLLGLGKVHCLSKRRFWFWYINDSSSLSALIQAFLHSTSKVTRNLFNLLSKTNLNYA